MLNRKVGIELEMAGDHGENLQRHYSERSVSYRSKYRFDHFSCEIGSDGSINYWPSMEMRISPISTLKAVPEIVNVCKKVGLFGCAKLRCGMHIHVDFPHNLKYKYSSMLVNRFNKIWLKRLMKEYKPHPQRGRYCSFGAATSHTRYSGLNVLGSLPTLEYRLFNCVLNTRYICRAIQMCLKITDDLEEYVKTIESG